MSDSGILILYLVLFTVAAIALWLIIRQRRKTTSPFREGFLTVAMFLAGALAGMMGLGLLVVNSFAGVIALLSLGGILSRSRLDGKRALGWFGSLPCKINRRGLNDQEPSEQGRTAFFFLAMAVIAVVIIALISNDAPRKQPYNTTYPSSTPGGHVVLPSRAPEEHVVLPIRTLFPTYITTWKNIDRSNIKVKSEPDGDPGLLEQAVAYYEPRDRFLGTGTVVQLAIMIERYETVEKARKRHGGPVIPASWGAKNSNFGWIIEGRSMELAPEDVMFDVGSVGGVLSIRVMTDIMGTYRIQVALLGFGDYAISGDGLKAVLFAWEDVKDDWP